MGYAEKRRVFEFDFKTKQEALQRTHYTCEICGREENREKGVYLQAHHRIAIWFALENPCLALEAIRSLANLEIVCRECHSKIHEQESRTYYAELAPIVLRNYLNQVIDPSKDDWREKLKYAKTRD
jgi:predicted HNH restriction endonuclease